ncbi:MAG: riboflavin synthase [Lachnospiraceae bacterium]|nr:riboflavin synthase [Lachnospiraceae bacterium]MBQ5850215.1 riboflavin synthase [Lachnospiraceae bacterium]
MFTGIVEELGEVSAMARGRDSMVLTIKAKTIMSDLKLGDSVSTNGVCLTVTEKGSDYYKADVMHETMNRSSLGKLKPGSHVNLERAMSAEGRFGGHIVSGHIDGTGSITSIKKDDNAVWYTIDAPENIMRYIIEKGSIAIDGISLTVAKVTDKDFSVSIIPHTIKETTLGEKRVGDIVNLENDLIGKYVEKLITISPKKSGNIDKEFLLRNGYI